MQIVIEWVDKQGDVVCTRDTGRWLEGETSAEVCITPTNKNDTIPYY